MVWRPAGPFRMSRFHIPRGRVTALIGPNGAGKSTLINCISGVDSAQTGSVLLAQRSVEALPAHEIAALGVARTFQNLKLFGRLTVLDNVLTGLTVAAERSFVVSMLRLPGLRHQERQLRLRALDALDDFRAGSAGALAGIGAVLRREETGGDGPRLRW